MSFVLFFLEKILHPTTQSLKKNTQFFLLDMKVQGTFNSLDKKFIVAGADDMTIFLKRDLLPF